MILARYISRQVLFTTLAITIVLLLVVVSGRLAAYISEAADGGIATSLVLPVVIFRLPQFLELILPVSLLLGIMISLGQLQETNEMTVMSATGVSHMKILRITLCAACFVVVIVSMFSFYLSPKGYAYINELVEEEGLRTELGNLAPATFYSLKNRGGTLYAGEVSSDQNSMSDVFVFRPSMEDEGRVRTVMHAQRGYQAYHENGAFYFVLEEGIRYEGNPGSPEFTVTQFDRYSQRIEQPKNSPGGVNKATETMLLTDLLTLSSDAVVAELHWRLSLPVMTLLLAMLAVPLSRSNPRQGRYFKLIPGMLFYLVYVVVVNIGRESVSEDGSNPFLVIWSVHLVVLTLALILFNAEKILSWKSSRQSSVTA